MKNCFPLWKNFFNQCLSIKPILKENHLAVTEILKVISKLKGIDEQAQTNGPFRRHRVPYGKEIVKRKKKKDQYLWLIYIFHKNGII